MVKEYLNLAEVSITCTPAPAANVKICMHFITIIIHGSLIAHIYVSMYVIFSPTHMLSSLSLCDTVFKGSSASYPPATDSYVTSTERGPTGP